MRNKIIVLILSFVLLALPAVLRPKTPKQRQGLRLLYLSAFLVLIIIGMYHSEYKDIYVNAITLCLSCIGIK